MYHLKKGYLWGGLSPRKTPLLTKISPLPPPLSPPFFRHFVTPNFKSCHSKMSLQLSLQPENHRQTATKREYKKKRLSPLPQPVCDAVFPRRLNVPQTHFYPPSISLPNTSPPSPQKRSERPQTGINKARHVLPSLNVQSRFCRLRIPCLSTSRPHPVIISKAHVNFPIVNPF